MNIFDAAVIGLTLLAIVMGFRSGLLRSLATIFGYVIAAPIALVVTPKLAPLLVGRIEIPGDRSGLLFLVVFTLAGLLLGALMRSAVSEIAGEHVSPLDRVAGAMLGAVRIVLVAVLLVLIFDRMIPAHLQPPWLAESRLRPVLLAAGQQGLNSLPPDLTAYIDRIKKERGL